jgi:poly(beta-D-mannuronate) lyase
MNLRYLFLGLCLACLGSRAATAQTKSDCVLSATMPYDSRIEFRGRGDDPTSTIMDPLLVARQAPLRRAVDKPFLHILDLADRYLAAGDRKTRSSLGRCLAANMAALNRNRSLFGSDTTVENFYRCWIVGGIALSYLKASDYLNTSPESNAIKNWLKISAADLQSFTEHRITIGKIENHIYWCGMAVAAVGSVNRNDEQLRFGRNILKLGTRLINNDGVLSAEITRGPKTLHYHAFAAQPLLTISILTRTPMRDFNRNGLFRLLVAIADGWKSKGQSGVYATSSGPQDMTTNKSSAYLFAAFVKPGSNLRRTFDLAAKPYKAKSHFLGGNISFLIRNITPRLMLS